MYRPQMGKMRTATDALLLDVVAPPDWNEYDAYARERLADELPTLEYEGWRDHRRGVVRAETYRGEAWDSEVRFSPDPAATHRYYLRRTWDRTTPPVAFVMLNPSTADERENDPTITRAIGFARAMGAGGLVVLNLFALRSTDPLGLRAVADPVGPENDRVLSEETRGVAAVVFAWGTHGEYMNRARTVIDLLKDRNPQCLHLTKQGHPGHPLYLSANRVPLPFPCSPTSAPSAPAKPRVRVWKRRR